MTTTRTPNPTPPLPETPSALPDGLARENTALLRAPCKTDGYAIYQLIAKCPPLDLNSVYAYLLLCEHFSNTCVVAQSAHGLDGFISAYIHPTRQDVLFVWQVAVHERARGQGLGRKMLQNLLQRPELANVNFIETTVGPDNIASRSMFGSLARKLKANVNESDLFEKSLFGPEAHEDEKLIRIGPFSV